MKEGKRYQIQKVISNNAVLALDQADTEVILLGKGIGFQRKKGDFLSPEASIEKKFVLSSGQHREALVRLFGETDDEVLRAVNEFVKFAETRMETKFSEAFLIAFLDHIAFAIKRLRQGIQIRNPFLMEVQSLYPTEYEIAEKGIRLLENRLGMGIPDDEIGFIALHLHSSRTKTSISKMNQFSEIIAKLVEVIEQELEIKIDKTSVDYSRLVTHLRHTIDRAEKGKPLGENHPLSLLLQQEYPLCYNLAWKLIKILQNDLQIQIPEAEASYLTLHLQRLLPSV